MCSSDLVERPRLHLGHRGRDHGELHAEQAPEAAAALAFVALDEFEVAATRATRVLGDFIVTDDADERLTLEGSGGFRAEVVPEEAEGTWRPLATAEELVEYYDPTDVFGDLADALADAYPSVLGGREGAEDDDRA